MRKPKIIVLIMSADLPFFKDQLEDCKKTWLQPVMGGAGSDLVGKYAEVIGWYYYDARFDEKVKCADCGCEVIPDSVKEDANDEHHLINVLYDDKYTFQKTYDVFNYIIRKHDFDYIIRTNTSTYLNLPLLSYYLYNEFNKNGWEDISHCTDLMSLPCVKCPEAGDIYMRGNCLVLTRRQIKDIILKYGKLYSYGIVSSAENSLIDDVCIGCLLNNFYNGFKKEGRCFDYLSHIKCMPQTWYKCTDQVNEFSHPFAPLGYATYIDETDNASVLAYASCGAIQIRSYYTQGGRAKTEHAHYFELHEKMSKCVFNIYKDEKSLFSIYNKIKEYAHDPMVWVQGNLPYIKQSQLAQLLEDDEKYAGFTNFLFKYMPADHFMWAYKARVMQENNLGFLLDAKAR